MLADVESRQFYLLLAACQVGTDQVVALGLADAADLAENLFGREVPIDQKSDMFGQKSRGLLAVNSA